MRHVYIVESSRDPYRSEVDIEAIFDSESNAVNFADRLGADELTSVYVIRRPVLGSSDVYSDSQYRRRSEIIHCRPSKI